MTFTDKCGVVDELSALIPDKMMGVNDLMDNWG